MAYQIPQNITPVMNGIAPQAAAGTNQPNISPQVNAFVSGGMPVGMPVGKTATSADDPVQATLSIFRMCTDAVAERIPTLQSQGKQLDSQTLLLECIIPKFASLLSGKSMVQNMSAPSNLMAGTGIAAPTIPGMVVPGTPQRATPTLIPVPGVNRLSYPDHGRERNCWWRTMRGDKKGQQCENLVGSSSLYCDGCLSSKKAAQTIWNTVRTIPGGAQALLNQRPGGGAVAQPASNMTYTPGITAPAVPAPVEQQPVEINVNPYPTAEGPLLRSAEGVIFVQPDNANAIALGVDKVNNGTIFPLSLTDVTFVQKIGAEIGDTLAKQYPGLKAELLNERGEFSNIPVQQQMAAPIQIPATQQPMQVSPAQIQIPATQQPVQVSPAPIQIPATQQPIQVSPQVQGQVQIPTQSPAPIQQTQPAAPIQVQASPGPVSIPATQSDKAGGSIQIASTQAPVQPGPIQMQNQPAVTTQPAPVQVPMNQVNPAAQLPGVQPTPFTTAQQASSVQG